MDVERPPHVCVVSEIQDPAWHFICFGVHVGVALLRGWALHGGGPFGVVQWVSLLIFCQLGRVWEITDRGCMVEELWWLLASSGLRWLVLHGSG